MVSGPAGSYVYGDSSHPHAVTSTSNGYSATYDAAGNLICRALTTTTCSGASPSGQQLTYDAQGRLSIWQDQPTSPTTTVNYLYDGSGNRVATQSTVNGTTTLTTYIGSIEEVQTTGSSTQTTTYYSVGGKRIAADVNGTFYSFGYDALGSQVAVLNSTGSLVGAQLYGPYGLSRYNTGTLPTSIGFTGQRADSVTGLDYYMARYYDPGVGQFLSVDSVQGNGQGMDPYAYVGGNPESRTDPTGDYGDPGMGACTPGSGGSGSGSGGSGSGSGSGGSTTQPTRPGHGGSKSARQKLPTNSNNGIKNPGLFAAGVGELIGGALLLGAIIGLATAPGGSFLEGFVWPVIATMAFYALRLAINGLRDMFEALDQVNKVAVVMLDIVEIALDIDITVFTSADIVFHLASIGVLGEVVDENASIMGMLRAGAATAKGQLELGSLMQDTLGLVSAGACATIMSDWQQLQADNQ